MATRDTAIGAFVAGVSPLSAATSNDAAGGKIGKARQITNSGSTTTLASDVIHVADVPVNASREVRIEFCGTFRTTVRCGVQVRIVEDGVMLRRFNFQSMGPFTLSGVDHDGDHTFTVWTDSQPSAGNHTYRIDFGISGTGGTAVLIADVDSPMTLDIYDVGAAVV